MKVLFLSWKDQNFEYHKYKDEITDQIIIHENGCVCGIEQQTHGLKLIDIMSKNELELLFSKHQQNIIEFENYHYSLENHPDYYLLEHTWKNQICLFLKANRTFVIESFSSFMKFSENDLLLSKRIAKTIIHQILIPKNYVQHYFSYFQVTENGKTWASEQVDLLQKQINKEVEKMKEMAQNVTYEEMIEREWGKYKNKSIKEVYEAIKKIDEASILPGFCILAYFYDRKDDIKDFLVRLNKPDLTPNMFKTSYKNYIETRKEIEQEEIEEKSINRKKPNYVPDKKVIEQVNENKNDPEIITANEYLKWLKVDIESKILRNPDDLFDKDKIKELHSDIKKNKQELNLHHPLNFTYSMAVLLAYFRIDKNKIKTYIKQHKHQSSILSEIEKRSKELLLILKDKK